MGGHREEIEPRERWLSNIAFGLRELAAENAELRANAIDREALLKWLRSAREYWSDAQKMTPGDHHWAGGTQAIDSVIAHVEAMQKEANQ